MDNVLSLMVIHYNDRTAPESGFFNILTYFEKFTKCGLGQIFASFTRPDGSVTKINCSVIFYLVLTDFIWIWN